jgi:hypothetical protein
MANAKVTHRSSAILCGSDGKAVKFSKAKALAYITPEKGKQRVVEVSGVFCDLFYMETSTSKKNGSMGLIGISLKGLVIETTAVKVVAETAKTEKASEPEMDLADLFGDETSTDETTETPAN